MNSDLPYPDQFPPINKDLWSEIPREALKELESLYRRVSRAISGLGDSCRMDGHCCRFAVSELRLFATGIEIVYLLHKEGGPPFTLRRGQCPYLDEKLCRAREGRPLGCRLYFCRPDSGDEDPALYERFHREIIEIHDAHGLKYVYGEFFKDPGWFFDFLRDCREEGEGTV